MEGPPLANQGGGGETGHTVSPLLALVVIPVLRPPALEGPTPHETIVFMDNSLASNPLKSNSYEQLL